MEINEFIEVYWNYYCQVESDFFALESFCAIDKLNDHSYSIKYLQLIQSICGEIDTICKRLCSCLDESLDINTCGINDYKNILMTYYPQIAKEKVIINRSLYREIKPWQSWEHKNTPHWWSAYNKVKHHRDEIWNGKEAYKHANQKTTIEALSALYIVIQYWAAYNFVLNNTNKNSSGMLMFNSKHLSIISWTKYYSFFMGNHFFEAEKFRLQFSEQNTNTLVGV